MTQDIITGFIVLAAAGYALYRVIRFIVLTGKEENAGCLSCSLNRKHA